MKHISSLFVLPFTCLLLAACCKSTPEVKISIFCDHIETIAQQEGISFASAAEKVWEIGYRGADVWVTQDPSHIKTLDSLGFEFPCAIAYIDFFESEQNDLKEAAVQFMQNRGIDRLLLVPGLKKENSDVDVTARIKAFADEAASKGFKVLLEDYDNWDSPCRSIADIDFLLNRIPSLGHNFDSGNYLFSGEDCLEALDKFKSRIFHVHLKDRVSADNFKCPATGTGCIPIGEIVQGLLSDGYTGWFTVEHFGAEDMLSYSRTSFENVCLCN